MKKTVKVMTTALVLLVLAVIAALIYDGPKPMAPHRASDASCWYMDYLPVRVRCMDKYR